jgi:hypothetical protein
MRATANLLNRINAIPPAQSPSAEIFRFSIPPNHIHNYRIPSHRGAFRDRHGHWLRDAMDARAAQDERSSCGRRSRVVLTLRCRRQGRGILRERRWQPSMVTEESAKETVKAIAQGRPDDPPAPVVLPRAFLLHAGHGCGGHPAFPAPSSLSRAIHGTARMRCAPRERRYVSEIGARGGLSPAMVVDGGARAL